MNNEEKIIKMLESLQIDIKTLKTDVQRLEVKVDKIELRMENEVIEKIRGLYDDREVQNDRFCRVESKLDDISTDVGYIAAKVAVHGKLAR